MPRISLRDLFCLTLMPDEDESDEAWEFGIAREWAATLRDPREDIYTLADGEPVDPDA
jgi:hypothetical protein